MAFAGALETCLVNGHRIAFHREGKGETVVLVHGITTNSFIWRRIVPLLRDDFEVLAVDLLGCGGSAMPLHVPYSLSNHADILVGLAEELGLDRFHLVGHDVGGGVSQIFAVRYPNYLIDLALVNSVANDFWPVQPIIAMRTPIVRQLAMATLDLGALRLIVGHGLYRKDRLTADLMSLFWQQMRTRLGRKAFLHFAGCTTIL